MSYVDILRLFSDVIWHLLALTVSLGISLFYPFYFCSLKQYIALYILIILVHLDYSHQIKFIDLYSLVLFLYILEHLNVVILKIEYEYFTLYVMLLLIISCVTSKKYIIMTTKQRLVKIEKLCSTHEKGADAAIIRLQSIVRELIEIAKIQQEEISSLWTKVEY